MKTDDILSILEKLEVKRRKQIMMSIQKNLQQAKATGDDKRYGQVASRKIGRTNGSLANVSSYFASLETGKNGYGKPQRWKNNTKRVIMAPTIRLLLLRESKPAPIQLPPPEPFKFHDGSLESHSPESPRWRARPENVDTTARAMAKFLAGNMTEWGEGEGEMERDGFKAGDLDGV